MRYFPRRYSHPGSAPGTLTDHTDAAPIPPQRRLIQYNVSEMTDKPIDANEPWPSAREGYVTWLHLQGTPQPDLMKQLGKLYGLHPLALEDVINAGQRPKTDNYGDYQFIVVNYLVRHADKLGAEQISLFLGNNFVISVHEGTHDIYDSIRARLQAPKMLRKSGADALAQALLDLIVDNGFPLVESMADRLEQIEDNILDKPRNDLLDQIHVARREVAFMRRIFWPQRDVVNTLGRNDIDSNISEAVRPYFRDVHDHTVQLLELVESYRDFASSLLDLYMSMINQRMNEVMKMLTMIATIFLPLSFIAGLYGMNFDTGSRWNMPELHWHFGYFYALFVMLAIVVGMIIFFKRKRWL